MILSYPYTGPTVTVTLPDPAVGNTDQLNIKTRFLRSMGGDNFSYKYTPAVRHLLLKLQVLTDTERSNLVTFLQAAMNEEIKLEWRGDTWKGKILNNPFEFSEDNTESSSISLEFEGVVV